MIIDAHTHIFPDAQAEAVLRNLSARFGIRTYGTGTAADLLLQMDEAGVDRAVIHMVAPGPGSVRSTNNWLIGLQQDRFIKFGTIHPACTDMRDELARLRDNGVPGVKLQPDIQLLSPDDRALMYPLYEELCRLGLKVMFHVGGEPHPGPDDRSKPHQIASVAADFPELSVVAAHLGGLNMWQDVRAHLTGRPNVWMETSLSYRFITLQLARDIITCHGPEKIFFGTDYPFGSISESLAAARRVGFLSARQRTAILGENAAWFFSA